MQHFSPLHRTLRQEPNEVTPGSLVGTCRIDERKKGDLILAPLCHSAPQLFERRVAVSYSQLQPPRLVLHRRPQLMVSTAQSRLSSPFAIYEPL